MPKDEFIQRLEAWVAGKMPDPYGQSQLHREDVRMVLHDLEIVLGLLEMMARLLDQTDHKESLACVLARGLTDDTPSQMH